MLISVGHGRFIQKTADSDSYKIVAISGHKWNAACECWDAVYSATRWFETYNEALNYAYRRGQSTEAIEIEDEMARASELAGRIGR